MAYKLHSIKVCSSAFQACIQMVSAPVQDELCPGYHRIHGDHVYPVWLEHSAPDQTTDCHGLWSVTAVLWSVLWCGWQRLRGGLHTQNGITYRGGYYNVLL